MTREETAKLQKFLQKTFRLDTIELRPVMKKDDMVEAYVGGEFVGPVYRIVDEDDGEVSWELRMAILQLDLDEV